MTRPDYHRDRAPATAQQALSPRQQAIAPIAASMAVGDMPQLNAALNQGLDAGLTVSEVKEILGQLYAYAGFPRSLNALGEMLKVMEARRQRGIQDAPGRDPSAPIPTGRELLALGTANQTRLAGAPVAGPLFEFSPQMDEYLKNHLFGAIFARDKPLTGKAANSPPSARWPPCPAWNRTCNRTSDSA